MWRNLDLEDDLSRMTARCPDAIVKVKIFIDILFGLSCWIYTIHGGHMLNIILRSEYNFKCDRIE